MDEIKVGEYIRTDKGTMGQIIEKRLGKFFKGKDDDEIPILKNVYELDTKQWTTDEYIVKHSKNIIGLIEVGDFVNGCLIVEISKDPFIKGQINLWTNMILSEGEPFPNEYYKAKILENEIKTILTHEMYEQNCYKVGEINE